MIIILQYWFYYWGMYPQPHAAFLYNLNALLKGEEEQTQNQHKTSVETDYVITLHVGVLL